MIRTRKGIVKKIIKQKQDVMEISVDIDRKEYKAIVYTKLVGYVKEGDSILLNTTAVDLNLGSGGVHFVIANLSNLEKDFSSETGHIIKMNYTPLQCRVISAEEEASPFRETLNKFTGLNNTPVIVASLHSMVAPVCATIKYLAKSNVKIVYVMSDSTALPLCLSKTISELKEKSIIDGTITYGHSFGGDIEAVNKFTALIAAKQVYEPLAIVVSNGIGNIGTGSKFGFSSVEQGEIINAVTVLGGTPVCVLRISFADKRERHYGISHHSLTVLDKITLASATVPVPVLCKEYRDIIFKQLQDTKIPEKHNIVEIEADIVLKALREYNIKVSTMGRSVEEDKEFFLACGAAGKISLTVYKSISLTVCKSDKSTDKYYGNNTKL